MSKYGHMRKNKSNLVDLMGTIPKGTEIRLMNSIGKGSWGVVYRAQNLHDPRIQYAVKVTDREMYKPGFDLDYEGRMHELASLASPQVVKYYGQFEDKKAGLHYLITDYCRKGDLRVRIEAESTPARIARRIRGNDQTMKSLLIQTLDAIVACHTQGLYHRDLKPDNLFLLDDSHVCLGDFGFATTNESSTSFGIGSEPFMSPECLNEFRRFQSYSPAQSDIWSFGMIMFTLVCGKFPWRRPSLDEYFYRLYVSTDEDILYSTFDISPEFNTLLKDVFTVNPRKRVSLRTLREQILNLRTFGSGMEREKKLIPDIRVPVFIDLDSLLPGGKDTDWRSGQSLAGLDSSEASSGVVELLPSPYDVDFPLPPDPAFSTVHVKRETDAEAECARRKDLQAIIELLETTLPSVSRNKCNTRRPPIVPHHTLASGDVWSSQEQSDDEPVTPETHAADAARPVAVAGAKYRSPMGEPPSMTLIPTYPPQSNPKQRHKSDMFSSVKNAKNRLREMVHCARAHPAATH